MKDLLIVSIILNFILLTGWIATYIAFDRLTDLLL